MVTRRAFLAAPAVFGVSGAAAQEFPSRPIRLIVSFPPGGPADILARDLAQRLSAAMPATVVVENRPGANGNIGAVAGARAQPDGHTLFMLTSSHCANMTLYRDPGYDVVRDFAPITNVVSYPLLLVAHPSQNLASVAQLVARARAEPERLTFASAGSGGGAHLAGELFAASAGIRMTHVPYNGTGPALLAVVAGQVALMFAGVSAALPHVEAGRLVALGVSSRRRLPSLPAVPTVIEAGIADYDVASWLGLAAPAGTPEAVVTRLNRAVAAVVQEPGFQAQLARDGASVEVTPPDAFSRAIASEVTRWAAVIRASGARLD